MRCSTLNFEVKLPDEPILFEATMVAKVVHNDETGLYAEGVRQWLYVMCITYLNFYTFHRKRGKLRRLKLVYYPSLAALVSTTLWVSYFVNTQCQHALCNAHHLRELTFVAEEMGQAWAKALIELLLALKAQVEEAKVQELLKLNTTRLTERLANQLPKHHRARSPG